MSTANTYEQEMLALINAERTSRGLNPLQLETRLNDSSEDHSAWMLNTDTFSHTGSGGSSATERMEDAGFDFSGSWRSGENIAWQSERGAPGISDDVGDLHQSLMNSPGHRANILNPDFEYIGIGIETGDMQGYDAVMVTQNFATTDAAVVLDNGGTPAPTVPAVPDGGVAQPDAPDTDQPDTAVTDTPDSDLPGTDTTETETPGTDTTETETPDSQSPDTEITETEDPAPEAPDTDGPNPDAPDMPVITQPGEGDFDLAALLAEIKAFLITLQDSLDQFEWVNTDRAFVDEDLEPVLIYETDVTEDTTDNLFSDMEFDRTDDEFEFDYVSMNCMFDAA